MAGVAASAKSYGPGAAYFSPSFSSLVSVSASVRFYPETCSSRRSHVAFSGLRCGAVQFVLCFPLAAKLAAPGSFVYGGVRIEIVKVEIICHA